MGEAGGDGREMELEEGGGDPGGIMGAALDEFIEDEMQDEEGGFDC
jgi:hypothetical protein